MSVVSEFWELPASKRREIIESMAVLTPKEKRLFEMDRVNLAFRRIGERKLQRRLVERVAKARGTDSAGH